MRDGFYSRKYGICIKQIVLFLPHTPQQPAEAGRPVSAVMFLRNSRLSVREV